YSTTSLSVPTTLSATTGTVTPGLRTNSLGNENLNTATSTAFARGFDMPVLNNRANLEVTYYSKQTKDALVSQPIAASAAPASTTVLRNHGSVKHDGIEDRKR